MKQELNDILINDDDLQKQNRTKKLMMMVAMALVFLCILIAVIFVLTSSDEEQSAEKQLAQNNGLVSAPSENGGFEPVAIDKDQEPKDEFERILADIRKQNGLSTDSSTATQSEPAQPAQPTLPSPSTAPKPDTKTDVKPDKPAPVLPTKPAEGPKKPEPAKEPAKPAKEPAKQEAPKTPVKSTQPAQPAQPVQGTQTAQAPKSTAPAAAPGAAQSQTPGTSGSVANAFDDVSTSRMDTSKNGQVAEKGFYIQVGSFANKPNAEFLKKISNYSYRVYAGTSSNGVQSTKYLIGPYNSRTEASRDLPNFKSLVENPIHFEVK